jgi:hypothetical protein
VAQTGAERQQFRETAPAPSAEQGSGRGEAGDRQDFRRRFPSSPVRIMLSHNRLQE